MPYYLLQVKYTPEAWAAQLKNPQDPRERIRPLVEGVGVRVEALYYAFGDYDVIALVEAPDNVSVAALSLAVTASGALTAVKTTPLMTVEEGMAAMRKGATASPGYRPPGA